jgi:hypothetical protein
VICREITWHVDRLVAILAKQGPVFNTENESWLLLAYVTNRELVGEALKM